MIIIYIISAVFGGLALLGLSELIHIVKTRLLCRKGRAITYSLLLLNGENPERQLAFAAEQRLWLGKNYSDFIIAVNSGLAAEDEELCRRTAERYNVIYCRAEELSEHISEYLPL